MGRLLWEAIQRSTTGPIMLEEKFETELLPNVLADVQARHVAAVIELRAPVAQDLPREQRVR